MAPFEAVHGYKPPPLPATGGQTIVTAVEEYLQQRRKVLEQLKQELAAAQNRMKQSADKRRSDREFKVGERVYLRLRYQHLKAITQGQVSKLSPKYFGPFPITARIGKVVYQLQLPEGTKIHPIFHVSLLKKSTGNERVSQELPTLPKEKEGPREPEAIIERRVIYHQGAPLIQVRVKWRGKSLEDTWKYLPTLMHQFPRTVGLLSIS